jgi:hypothetical protein
MSAFVARPQGPAGWPPPSTSPSGASPHDVSQRPILCICRQRHIRRSAASIRGSQRPSTMRELVLHSVATEARVCPSDAALKSLVGKRPCPMELQSLPGPPIPASIQKPRPARRRCSNAARGDSGAEGVITCEEVHATYTRSGRRDQGGADVIPVEGACVTVDPGQPGRIDVDPFEVHRPLIAEVATPPGRCKPLLPQ